MDNLGLDEVDNPPLKHNSVISVEEFLEAEACKTTEEVIWTDTNKTWIISVSFDFSHRDTLFALILRGSQGGVEPWIEAHSYPGFEMDFLSHTVFD